MADRNEPGGSVVPSATAEIRREALADTRGTIAYVVVVLSVASVIVAIVALA